MTVVETVGWVLVHFLWQGAAIAALFRIVLALAAPSSPALRYGVGCAALALMLSAPLATAARFARTDAAPSTTPPRTLAPRGVMPSPGESNALASPVTARSAAPDRPLTPALSPQAGQARRTPLPFEGRGQGEGYQSTGWTLPAAIRARITAMLPWLVGLWALGVMLLSVRLAGGWWRTRALRTRGIEAIPEAWQRVVARLLARMRITRGVAFFVSSRVTTPIVFGHVKPIVLVPAAVLAGLSPSQLEAILAHELAHVRRHDYLANLLQTVIETVFFYHPAVWWVSRQVRQAREECCDDIAVAACGDRKDYVEALLGLEQMRHAAAPVALGATGGSLLARARRLLLDTEREGTSPRLTASAIAIAVAGLAMAGITMAATEPVLVEHPRSSFASSASSGSSASSASSVPAAPAAPTAPAPTGPTGPTGPIAPDASATPSDAASASAPASASASASAAPVAGAPLEVMLSEPQQTSSPQPVIAAPDPAAPFAARREWAAREARTRRASRYWLGYSIRPVKGLPPILYFDRDSTVMTRGGVRISGHMFSDRSDGLRYSGEPLAVADADPASIKILFLLDARDGSPRLSRVHASTLPLPFDAHGRPIFWIGGADTASSLALIDGLYATAPEEDKRDLVNTAGIHDDSPAVVAWLERRVRSAEPDGIRAEAVEALAWHPIPASLAALERAARRDRASFVRREAAEALGDLAMPEAAPVLIALAKSLDDLEARREAIEALGERSEMAARDALGAIAREDPNADMQREAVETLGDFTDGRGVALVREILRDHPNPEVRREAIETLVDRATPAEALAMLRDVLQRDAHVSVRREAVERLADIKDGAGRSLLIEIARTHASEDVRAEATESLGDLEPSAEIVHMLRQIAASDATLRVRGEAIETLADLPNGQGIDALIEIARNHTDRDTRKKAVEALADSGDPRARQLFEQILTKPSGE